MPARGAGADGRPFDAVVFNFPHVGGSRSEDVAANQDLLRGFFTAARALLCGDDSGTAGAGKRRRLDDHVFAAEAAGAGGGGPEVHVTLRRTPFYDSWGVDELAEECG